jgi:hypothetical protein
MRLRISGLPMARDKYTWVPSTVGPQLNRHFQPLILIIGYPYANLPTTYSTPDSIGLQHHSKLALVHSVCVFLGSSTLYSMH